MPDWQITLSDLDFGAEEEAAALRVLRRKWLSMGGEVEAFEQAFARMQGVPHAIALSNATAGLHLSMLALGIGPGDEVIQPALNFVATANMTVACGAVPVFADIVSLDEPTIDPQQVSAAITPRTKAVVVMHYGGSLCRMAELTDICRARGIALIEDACHALGVAYVDPSGRPPDGVMAGSIGDVSAFSFYSNKNLATGEGGMVVTARDDLAQKVRLLRSHGMTSVTWDRHHGHASSYDVAMNGYNYRLDDLRAAIGRAQFAKLADNNRRRRALLALYRDRLQRMPGWSMPFGDRIEQSSGHLMVAVAPSPETRRAAGQRLRDAGIQSSMHYPCITEFSAFRDCAASPVDVTKEFTRRAITLPLYPTMPPAAVETVCAHLDAAG
jgi:dTDP-4-amino-4,6-dideoxygalactose transaminase